MGREVRMVPENWEHPRYDENHTEVVNKGRKFLVGRYIPLFNQNYEDALYEWKEGKKQWKAGFQPTYSLNGERYEPKTEYQKDRKWSEYAGSKPKPEDYMPSWTNEERTHFMMYETTSEGTPISPAFATAKALARWLADTNASSFADMTATYEQWLHTIDKGSAVSAIIDSNGLRSGVEAGI